MAARRDGRWAGEPLVPMMVLMPEQQRAAMLASGAAARPSVRLDQLYDEAMAKFDAFCFWYARPGRSPAGLREIAKRLESYGSPEALRIAGDVRVALTEAG
ncbi:MAG: hypothetical protein IT555_18605 [Acetobacteraceae bacterium]|nr:hypothetical protein [Acetobacteraceae bacterium]